MTSKTTTGSPPLLSNNHTHTDPRSPTTDLSASSTSVGSCTVNGPTCASESSNHRLHLSAAVAASTSSQSGQERSSSTNTIKDYFSGNPSMSCCVPALTNIPISKHLRSRDLGAAVSSGTGGGGPGGSGLKIGRQLNNSEASTSSSSSFHVSFHGLGRDSFRLTNSDQTGFIDLAAAAATMSSNTNNSRGNLVTDGRGSGGVFNHNGTTNPSSILPKSTASRPDANSLVLRSGTAANLRHRPYSVNHKTATKSSS